MPKPNFFIVGAAKCGTTSLYHYLEQHPEIGMASYKEPCFFCYNQLYDDEELYLNLFSHLDKKIEMIGEASTNYLAAPESPKLIHNYNKHAKIIIVLRNPVNRAFSLYKWMVRAGFDYAASFEKALKLEDDRKKKSNKNFSPVKYNYFYYSSGLYFNQVKRYYDLFGKDQILVINFEDLKSNLDNTLKEVYSFLQVYNFKIKDTKIYNKAKFPYSPRFQHFVRNDLYNKLTIKKENKNKMYGNLIIDFLSGVNSNLGTEPELKLTTARMLQENYNSDLNKLTNLIPFSTLPWQNKY